MIPNSNGSAIRIAPPVNMVQFSEEALLCLRAELLMSETVGKDNVYNIPASFDTEASSFEDDDGNPVGLCYIWMFGIKDYVVYGRYLDEFVTLVSSLNEFMERQNTRLYVYVHFLKYDFSFIKKLFVWKEVFSRANREPLFAITGRFEFRDSLALAGGRSLAYIGDKILRKKVRKAVGDLNYDLVRTPETPLTNFELHYCEMDIRVLNEYIREKIEDDGDIKKIPLTNTGYVRNYVRAACFRNRGRYMDFIDGLTLTPDAYLQCERAFGGGAVGPNIKYVGQTCKNVHSYDIKSSYPYVMVAKYFPMQYPTPIKNIDAQKNIDKLCEKYCVLFRLEIFNLIPRYDYCFPISESKCNEVIGARVASGRVITAAYVSINVTELDYDTIKKFYKLEDAEKVRVTRCRIFERGYLPKPIIESILKFFFDKTTLDGIPDKIFEYMISKNMLNSLFGMMVEKIVRAEITFDEEFRKSKPDYVRQVIEYNEKRNRFLYYPWGVWVTAHARHRLYSAILAVGDDFRYCDTDSVKFVGNHDEYFKRENNLAWRSMALVAERLNVEMQDVIPKSPDGTMKCLGVWEHEWDADRFKTIGAKRYLVDIGGKLELTVAGTNKESTLEYMKERYTYSGIFEAFNEDLVIPKEYAKRTVAKFVDSERSGYVKDYTGVRRWYSALSGVNITPSSYSFSITDEMLDAILWLTHDGHYTESEI